MEDSNSVCATWGAGSVTSSLTDQYGGSNFYGPGDEDGLCLDDIIKEDEDEREEGDEEYGSSNGDTDTQHPANGTENCVSSNGSDGPASSEFYGSIGFSKITPQSLKTLEEEEVAKDPDVEGYQKYSPLLPRFLDQVSKQHTWTDEQLSLLTDSQLLGEMSSEAIASRIKNLGMDLNSNENSEEWREYWKKLKHENSNSEPSGTDPIARSC